MHIQSSFFQHMRYLNLKSAEGFESQGAITLCSVLFLSKIWIWFPWRIMLHEKLVQILLNQHCVIAPPNSDPITDFQSGYLMCSCGFLRIRPKLIVCCVILILCFVILCRGEGLTTLREVFLWWMVMPRETIEIFIVMDYQSNTDKLNILKSYWTKCWIL